MNSAMRFGPMVGMVSLSPKGADLIDDRARTERENAFWRLRPTPGKVEPSGPRRPGQGQIGSTSSIRMRLLMRPFDS